MGHQPGGQDHLFYSFNLESVVPQNHLLRGIDRCLDLTDLRQYLAEYYSHKGRPSIDPVLMIRMLVVGCWLLLRQPTHYMSMRYLAFLAGRLSILRKKA